MKSVLRFLHYALLACTSCLLVDAKKMHLVGDAACPRRLGEVAAPNYTAVVRIGLLAGDKKSLVKDQGFLVRKGNLMEMVANRVHNGVLFQVNLYHCNRHGSGNK